MEVWIMKDIEKDMDGDWYFDGIGFGVENKIASTQPQPQLQPQPLLNMAVT